MISKIKNIILIKILRYIQYNGVVISYRQLKNKNRNYFRFSILKKLIKLILGEFAGKD